MSRSRVRVALFALAAVLAWWGSGLPERSGDDASALRTAWEDGTSGVWVEGSGEVVRILPDDRSGSRHQRFILQVYGGQTLLISHNIDLAPRLEPIGVGDTIEFRGKYEWNDQGGLVHWTHHDPAGRLSGGWLEARGRRVR
ncbi:MAG: DUF3465 domain-containing protein [Gemmatimonadota bacterium]|nr:DUF3465 domain-containing protein [Gemmatimonadota bacterium]